MVNQFGVRRVSNEHFQTSFGSRDRRPFDAVRGLYCINYTNLAKHVSLIVISGVSQSILAQIVRPLRWLRTWFCLQLGSNSATERYRSSMA